MVSLHAQSRCFTTLGSTIDTVFDLDTVFDYSLTQNPFRKDINVVAKQHTSSEDTSEKTPEHTIENLPALLAQTRATRRLTLNEVSQQTGLTVSTLSRIENGIYKPRAETFIKLLQWLELSPRNVDAANPTQHDTMSAIALILQGDPQVSAEAVQQLLRAWRPMYELYRTKDT